MKCKVKTKERENTVVLNPVGWIWFKSALTQQELWCLNFTTPAAMK